jgi:hypothetical protein
MSLFRGGDRQARKSRKPQGAVLQVETLEDRLVPSWGSTPPLTIAVPPAAVAVRLNGQKDARGVASNIRGEVDFFRFTAPSSGVYHFEALTPPAGS